MAIALDGSAVASASAATSVSAALTTAGPGIVVAVVQTNTDTSYDLSYPAVVLSDAGGKVTSWKLQYEFPVSIANPFVQVQVWWGVSSGAMSGNSFTATVVGSQTKLNLMVFGVSGANTTSPFDTNTSIFPDSMNRTNGFGASAITNAFNTSCTNAMVICLAGHSGAAPLNTASAGFTLIQASAATANGTIGASYKVVAATQSGITPNLSTNIGNSTALTMGFAIAAAGETACNAVPPVPLITATNSNGSTVAGTTITAALTTQQTGGVVFALVSRNANQAVTMSDSASAITWTKYGSTRSSSTDTFLDVWKGTFSGLLSADTITATLAGSVTARSILVFHVINCDTTTPYDANVSLPAVNSSSGFVQMATTSFSTTSGNVLVLGISAAGSSATPRSTSSSRFIPTGGVNQSASIGLNIFWSRTAISGATDTLGLVNSNYVTIVTAIPVAVALNNMALAQTVPAFSQALTGTVTGKLVQSKAIPDFGQAMTGVHTPAHGVISTLIPAFPQALRMGSTVKGSLSQTINPFGVSLRMINGAIVSNVRTRPGTMRAEARPRRVT